MRVRCVFSEGLNDMSLGRLAAQSPGEPSGTSWERARLRAPEQAIAPGHGARPERTASTSHRNTPAAPVLRPAQPLRHAQALLHDLVATVFPADCLVCEAPLTAWSALPVCEVCLAAPQPQKGALCSTCGEALGFEADRAWQLAATATAHQEQCALCRKASPPFHRAVAFGVYERELRALLHLFKYDRVRGLSAPLGAMLAQAIAGLEPDLAEGALVVPVPLHAEKRRDRGFNQTELLARSAVRLLAGRMRLQLQPGLLVRVRATESQFGLNPRQRRANLRGAFAAGPQRELAALRGRDVILVDDILTTGATARACAKVLGTAGANRVYVATLARAQPDLVALWEAADA